MAEADLATYIVQAPAINIVFEHHIRPDERLRPDQYYEWMPRHGILQFGSVLEG